MPKNTGCGTKPKQNKSDGVFKSSSNSERQSPDKTKKPKSGEKTKPASAGSKLSAKPIPQWVHHKYKHIPKDQPWSQTVQDTKHGDAKYITRDLSKIEILERDIWENGIPVTNGRTYKVHDCKKIIGAYLGKEVQHVVVKYDESAKILHGHPIDQAEYNKLIRKR